MSIIQKMLVVPLLSLLLYGGFSVYSMVQQQRNQAGISDLRDNYAPLVLLTKENIRLFDEIGSAFANAVAASEAGWLEGTDRLHRQLLENFDAMERYEPVVDPAEIQRARRALNTYMESSREFAYRVINHSDALISGDTLVDSVESYRSRASALFETMEQDIQGRFEGRLIAASQSLYRIQIQATVFAILLIFGLAIATIWVALTTKRQISEVVERMRDLAMGSTDFSQRLERRERDELWQLVYWFNRLSDKLEQSYSELAEISITDKLTQLNNRTRTDQFFPERIAAALESGRSFAVVLLDIDHFKSINDHFGHQAGDDVLQDIAGILKNEATENDFIARWGGEEFILLLSADNVEQATRQAHGVRRAIEAHDFGEVGTVTASFGLTMFEDGDSESSLVNRADASLYRAKSNGRNRVELG